jgi:transcription elongation GreA/GreB family factor
MDIVDPAEWVNLDMEDMPRAMLGAKIEILRGGTKETLLIGGAWDASLDNPQIIPYTSPLGKCLIPKRPGFKTTLETSGEEIELLSSKAPTKEDIKEFYKKDKTKSKENSKTVEEVSMM